MRITKKSLFYTILAVFAPMLVVAAVQTINSLPLSNSSYLSTLQAYLRDEIPARFQKRYAGYLFEGGIGTTSGNLAHTITASTGFPHGYYATQGATSHTYTASTTTYVYLDYDDARTITIAGANVTRATRLVFAEMVAGADEPETPLGTIRLMRVDTGLASITSVTDLRSAGDIDAEAYGSLANAAAKAVPCTLVLSKLERTPVNSALTMPSYITLKAHRGGGVYLADGDPAGNDLIIQGSVEAGDYQIFYGPGSVYFQYPSSVRADWWGTSSASNNSVQKAIDGVAPCGSVVHLAGHRYVTPGILMEINGDCTKDEGKSLVGEADSLRYHDNFGTELYLADESNNTVLKMFGSSTIANRYAKIVLDKLKIDGNGINQSGCSALTPCHGINMSNLVDVSIGEITIENAHDNGWTISGPVNGIVANYVEIQESGVSGSPITGCGLGADFGALADSSFNTFITAWNYGYGLRLGGAVRVSTVDTYFNGLWRDGGGTKHGTGNGGVVFIGTQAQISQLRSNFNDGPGVLFGDGSVRNSVGECNVYNNGWNNVGTLTNDMQVGVRFSGNAAFNSISYLHSWNINVPASSLVPTQQWGAYMSSSNTIGEARNVIGFHNPTTSIRGAAGNTTEPNVLGPFACVGDPALATTVWNKGNYIGYPLRQAIAVADLGTTTIDPGLGENVVIGTSDDPINANIVLTLYGRDRVLDQSTLTLYFVKDNTANTYTVTFSGAVGTVVLSSAYSLTKANERGMLKLVYEKGSWRDIARHTDP